MDGFATIAEPSAPVAAEEQKAEPSKPKAKRAARSKAKKKLTASTLPDLTNFATIFECVHWLTNEKKRDWDEVLSKANEKGLAVIMEDSDIKGVVLPYEIYNELLNAAAQAASTD